MSLTRSYGHVIIWPQARHSRDKLGEPWSAALRPFTWSDLYAQPVTGMKRFVIGSWTQQLHPWLEICPLVSMIVRTLGELSAFRVNQKARTLNSSLTTEFLSDNSYWIEPNCSHAREICFMTLKRAHPVLQIQLGAKNRGQAPPTVSVLTVA